MFVRFIAAGDSDNPWGATGVITIARVLRDEGKLEAYEVQVVDSAFEWFNQNLPCPPFGENRESGTWTKDSVSWFLPDAEEPIARMWDLITILKEHGMAVRVFRTRNPGNIVYRDAFQVVAETPGNA